MVAMIDRQFAIEDELSNRITSDPRTLVVQIQLLAYHHSEFD